MVDISNKAFSFMKEQQFIFTGTVDADGRPHTSAKILLKIDRGSVWLVDYVKRKTYTNLTANPSISLSAVDSKDLIGYQLYGEAALMSEGEEFHKLLKELNAKQVNLTAKSLVSKLRKGVRLRGYALAEVVPLAMIEVKAIEATQIMPTGEIKKEKVKRK